MAIRYKLERVSRGVWKAIEIHTQRTPDGNAVEVLSGNVLAVTVDKQQKRVETLQKSIVEAEAALADAVELLRLVEADAALIAQENPDERIKP